LADSITHPGTAQLNAPGVRYRPSAAIGLHIHSYLPIAVVYFFFNNAGLPIGLTYTMLLSPFLFLWLYLKGRRWLTTKFLLVLSPFIIAHMVLGIAAPLNYLRTTVHLWVVYVVVYAFCLALMKCGSVDRLFDQLIVLNFCAAVFAIATFPTPLKTLLWNYDSTEIASASNPLRLSLLTLEPSGYSELMLPLLIFATLRLLCHGRMRNFVYLIMVGVPFLLCQSMGGLGMCLAAIGISLMTSNRRLLTRPKSLIVIVCLVITFCALLLTPNPVSHRLVQVATGNDSSTNVRTTVSFLVAYTLASQKSLWWGIGLGQAKLIDVSGMGTGLMSGIIPNQVAGMLAEFGLIAVLLEFVVEFYLFFRTRVYLNSFRLAMFVVAFIAQLTGSSTASVQQYLMWFFAFCPIFPDVNLRDDFKSKVSHT
jgi:hypothetical protein